MIFKRMPFVIVRQTYPILELIIFFVLWLSNKSIKLFDLFIILTVGNIPYDATEEQLREVFIQAGPVISFRLVC